MFTTRSLAVLALSAIVAARADDPAPYPKPLAEVKAIMTLLAPAKGDASDEKVQFLQRLKMYRFVCDVPYEDIS